jgi:hypothetical protein
MRWPGGYLVSAFKAGDGSLHRAGRSTGLNVEFDTYWLPPAEVERLAIAAGFATVFWGGVPPEKEGLLPRDISSPGSNA